MGVVFIFYYEELRLGGMEDDFMERAIRLLGSSD